MLNVAMVGCWHVHTNEYADQLRTREDVKLVAVWDDDAVRARMFCEQYHVVMIEDYDVLLANADIDAICINAPTNEHCALIVKAAKAGKHIFTEKVMALTKDECHQIKSAIDDAGVKFVISFPHRTHSRCLYAKKVLDDALLGAVHYLRIRNAHDGASRGWLPAHFYDKKACGGGAMIDLGAHPMYLVAWLMGKPETIQSTFTQVTQKPVEDNAVCVMTYPDGSIAVSETGFVTSSSPFTLEMHGTKGSLIIQGDDIHLLPHQSVMMPETMPAPIFQFVDACLYDKPILLGLNDAIVLTEIMEAAYKAHATKMLVHV